MVLDIYEQEFSCPICDCVNNSDDNYELNELVECEDCGSEFEITGLSPMILVEIEQGGEDWGE